MLVVGFAVAGLGTGGGGSAVSHPSASRPATGRGGLASLPVALRGPVSRTLGSADRSYIVRSGSAGLSAVNAGQGLRIGFGRSGVVVRAGSSALSLRLA